MSTATADTAALIAANRRSISAIKADMANALSNRPETLLSDAKAALWWLPRKARNAAMATFRFLRMPQIWAFAKGNFYKLLGAVGGPALSAEVLTSKWGQTTIRTSVNAAGRFVRFSIRMAWKIVTSPLQLFSPARPVIARIEARTAKAVAKFIPESGETFGLIQVGRDMVGYQLSSDRVYMKLIRITAWLMMSVHATQRYVPSGWVRGLLYALDALLVARAYGEALDRTWLGRRLNVWAEATKDDVEHQVETVIAEGTRMTREAAAETASKMRAEAAEIEATTLEAAGELSEDMIAEGGAKAAELRRDADALEATAARMETPGTAVAVAERPKPGPTVPPKTGGPSPGANGPTSQSHPQHGRKQTQGGQRPGR